MVKKLLFIFSLFILFTACKKEGDDEAPRITILSPNEGTSYAFGDTILIQLEVSDNQIVERVSARILKDGISVSPVSSRVVQAASATLALELVIDNTQLITGSHTLSVRASDGKNDQNVFRTLYIQELPLAFKGLLAVSQNGANTILTRADSVFTVSTVGSFAMDVNASAINSTEQQCVIAGGINGDLNAVAINTGTVNWTVPNLNIGTVPYFHSVNFNSEEGLFYIQDDDGNIRGRNAHGTVIFSSSIPSGFRAKRSWILHDKFLSLQKSTTATNYQLSSYFLPSGAVQANFPSDMDIVAAFERNATEGVLFGNRGSDGVIRTYTDQFGPGFELRDIPGTQITSVVQLSNNDYIVATENGIYQYTYTMNGLLTISSLAGMKAMSYELLTGAIYGCITNQVYALNPTTGASNVLFSTNGIIQGLHVVYNK